MHFLSIYIITYFGFFLHHKQNIKALLPALLSLFFQESHKRSAILIRLVFFLKIDMFQTMNPVAFLMLLKGLFHFRNFVYFCRLENFFQFFLKFRSRNKKHPLTMTAPDFNIRSKAHDFPAVRPAWMGLFHLYNVH